MSAADLTWSYASALTAFQARDGFVGASWGAAGLVVPAACSTGGSGGSGSGGTVAVTFNVQATTEFGGEYLLELRYALGVGVANVTRRRKYLHHRLCRCA